MENTKIIEEYLAGKSISKLSKELNLPYCRIQKILRDNKITIRGGRKKKELTQEQLIELKELTEQGKTLNELSEIFQLDKAIIKRIREENNIYRKNLNRINKNIKSDYFSKIDNAEKAYWLGFLFTDGAVDNYKSKRIRFQLQEADLEILEKYKEDLSINSKIIYNKRKNSVCCSVEFTDSQIFNDLNRFGIVPNKTYKTTHIPYELIPEEFLPAFILGLFDGDGGLSYSKDFFSDVTINFTSYYETIVEDFQYLIDNYILHKNNHNKNFFTSAWHTQWRGRKQVLQILDILYNNSPRHLERKYQKYLLLKDSLK